MSPRTSLVLGVRSRFPVLVRGRRAPCSSRAVPSRSHLFHSVQTLSCQSSPVERLSPLIFGFAAAGIRASLRRCFACSPSSAVFCRCLPIGLMLPPLVSPISCRLHCLLVFPGLALISSSLALAADQVGFRPSRCASSPFCLLGKGRPGTLGLCVADGSR